MSFWDGKERPIMSDRLLEAAEAIIKAVNKTASGSSAWYDKIADILREKLGDESEKDQRIALLKSNLADSEVQREELCRKVYRLEAENAKMRKLIDGIDELRKEEGASVTLFCDNPDFEGPNNAIEICSSKTNWKTVRYEGNSLLEAILAAKGEE